MLFLITTRYCIVYSYLGNDLFIEARQRYPVYKIRPRFKIYEKSGINVMSSFHESVWNVAILQVELNNESVRLERRWMYSLVDYVVFIGKISQMRKTMINCWNISFTKELISGQHAIKFRYQMS